MIFGRKTKANDCCNIEIIEAKDEACCEEEQAKQEACCPPGCC